MRGTDGWSIQALEELRIILIRQACQITWEGHPLFAQEESCCRAMYSRAKAELWEAYQASTSMLCIQHAPGTSRLCFKCVMLARIFCVSGQSKHA